MASTSLSRRDSLPALVLPAPLSIDFDFDLDLAHVLENNERSALQSPRTPTYDDVLKNLESNAFHDTSSFFEFPQIKFENNDMSDSTSSCSMDDQHQQILEQNVRKQTDMPDPPSKPLDWIWICHMCHSRYLLGATRRCLVDGHYYCSGETSTTIQRNVKRRKRGTSCSSEFDYIGWKEWGVWRRNVLALRLQRSHGRQDVEVTGENKDIDDLRGLRGCENCEYPSECRHEKIRTATKTKFENDILQDNNSSPTSPTNSDALDHRNTTSSVNNALDPILEDNSSYLQMTGVLDGEKTVRPAVDQHFKKDLGQISNTSQGIADTSGANSITLTQTSQNSPIPTIIITPPSDTTTVTNSVECKEKYQTSSTQAATASSHEQTSLPEENKSTDPIPAIGTTPENARSEPTPTNPQSIPSNKPRKTERYYSKFQESEKDLQDTSKPSLASAHQHSKKNNTKNKKNIIDSKRPTIQRNNSVADIVPLQDSRDPLMGRTRGSDGGSSVIQRSKRMVLDRDVGGSGSGSGKMDSGPDRLQSQQRHAHGHLPSSKETAQNILSDLFGIKW